jgi:hypothetical protein
MGGSSIDKTRAQEQISSDNMGRKTRYNVVLEFLNVSKKYVPVKLSQI